MTHIDKVLEATPQTLSPGMNAANTMPFPQKERTHKCKNHMLECINDYKNLSVNGSKDSKYNDLIAFEDHFNGWDSNLIVLEKITYGHEGEPQGRPYVYVTIEGIYDNIGMFARKLQDILPYDSSGLTISCMDFGGDLNISIHDGKWTPFSQPTYRAKTHKLNQIKSHEYIEGSKWHITKV